MKNVLFAIALLITITGCTASKNVLREKESTSSQSESHIVTATKDKKEVKTESKSVTDTHTSILCDTNITIAGTTLQGEKSLADLMADGDFNLASETVVGNIHFDSATGKIKMTINESPRNVPLYFHKVSDARETKDQQIQQDENSSTTDAKDQKSSSESQIKVLQKQVERTFPWWIIPVVIVAGLIIIFGVGFLYKRLR